VHKVLVTGGTGFIGRRLVEQLLERGDRVTVLTRDANRARRTFPERVRCAAWTPEKAGPWVEELAVVDTVVHLAGEPVAQRWTAAVKDRIKKSRVDSTRLLVEAIGKSANKPSTLVSASAIGFYGPHGADDTLDEASEPGRGFLAGVVQEWEEAARSVESHGLRSVQVRIGIVLGEGGGPLEKMMLPFKFFAGGPLGDGKQIISWVHREDVVGMILLAIDDERVKGPINAVSPNPVSGKELANAIGIVMGRPSSFKTPSFVLGLMLGEGAEVATTGQRVFPKTAVELGYEFHHARLIPALESVIGDR
jgi:uncharacterized protein (TIGR01777 family)